MKFSVESKYHERFQEGLKFQDYVADILMMSYGIPLSSYSSEEYQMNVGENIQGIEIKLDNRCTETLRLSIEIAEKTDPKQNNYTPSGIYRCDNSWLYIQGNTQRFYCFAKNTLKLLHKTGRYQEHTLPTISKFYLSFADCDRYCAFKHPA